VPQGLDLAAVSRKKGACQLYVPVPKAARISSRESRRRGNVRIKVVLLVVDPSRAN